MADHQGVREFAVAASAGIAIAFLCVIVLLPCLLLIWPRGKARPFPIVDLPVVRYGRPRRTFAVFGLVIVLAIVGLSRIGVDTHVLEELDKDGKVVQDFTFYENHFQGLLNLEVHLRGDLKSMEAFRAIEKLQVGVAQAPDVNSSESYIDWLREIVNQQGEISDEQILLAVIFLSAAGDHLPRHVINPDFDQGRIRFYLRGAGTKRFLEFKETIESEARKFPPGLTAEVSSYAEMAHESTRLVVVTMLQSLIITLVVITVMLSLMYRSWHLGLLAILPNSLPILVALGVTGWLGIHLRIGIVMIYSVGIGLAVDDTIHMLSRYRSEKLRNPQLSPRENLQETLRTTGTALIITSIILVAGALCYLPATLQSMRDVGLLLTAIVLTALFSDLYLLPLLVEHSDQPSED